MLAWTYEIDALRGINGVMYCQEIVKALLSGFAVLLPLNVLSIVTGAVLKSNCVSIIDK
jgi:hypothetical protein